MANRRRRRDVDRFLDDESEPTITACETSPGRIVFTEEDNTEAWIATDVTVDVER